MKDQPMAGERPWLGDFATVFAHLWYQNFPAHPMFRRRMEQADLTIHIGAAVRATADLMGLFAHFEGSVRTGAVLRDNIGVAAAVVEWEYRRLTSPDVNEVDRLKERAADPDFKGMRFGCRITYIQEDVATDTLKEIQRHWAGAQVPLLLISIVFRMKPKPVFTKLTFHEVRRDGTKVLLREQDALPWHVGGSRWESPD